MVTYRLAFELPTFVIQARPMVSYFDKLGYDPEFVPGDDGLTGSLTLNRPLSDDDLASLEKVPFTKVVQVVE